MIKFNFEKLSKFMKEENLGIILITVKNKNNKYEFHQIFIENDTVKDVPYSQENVLTDFDGILWTNINGIAGSENGSFYKEFTAKQTVRLLNCRKRTSDK